jgi:hypothetical protein
MENSCRTEGVCSSAWVGRKAHGSSAEKHWDELNLLEVFQQIGAATVRKAEDNEPLDVAHV